MKKIIYLSVIILSLIFSTFSLSEEYISGKVISLLEESIGNEEEGIEKISKFKVKILNGTEKGKEVEVDFPTYLEKQYNMSIKVGDKVVLYKSYDSTDSESGKEEVEENIKAENLIERIDISDVDKRNIFYFLTLIFVGLTVFIAKKNGLKSLLALFLTLIFIIKIFIPAIAQGYSSILFAVLTCIFSTVITTLLITGFSKKTFIAILGTTSGVIVAGLLSYSFGNLMRLTGYDDADVLSYAGILSNIDLKELISAGVIIGSLGAVMDVAVSISSSINELYEINPNIEEKVLFKSAMNIGNDIIGTMINTLILAYIGSSMLTILLVYIQSSEYPLIRVLNYEDIAVEILRAVCGSIGILISVPLTSYMGTKIYKK